MQNTPAYLIATPFLKSCFSAVARRLFQEAALLEPQADFIRERLKAIAQVHHPKYTGKPVRARCAFPHNLNCWHQFDKHSNKPASSHIFG